MRDSVTWYLLLQVAAVAVWPFVARALAPLTDRGWAAAKTVGPLLIAWLVWLVCMVAPIPFTRLTLLLALLAVGAAAWVWLWRSGGIEPMLAWIAEHRVLLG